MSANVSDLGATRYETKGDFGETTPAGDAIRQTIAGLLGTGVAVEELALKGNHLPTKYTGIHTTQGIPLMLSGQADVVQVDLSEKVAAYPDPIKLVLQFLYTEGRKVVITKRTVTGGGIGVVPERTRGQVASMQVETRSEVLTRYGGDITMNLNAWLKPAEAAAELSSKLAAQRRELEKTLVRIGYETVMKSGTPLLDAIVNSNSVYGMQNRRGDPAAARFAQQVYNKSLFGALSRFKYPLPNLLAAARKASAYRPGNAGVPSILILPHGLPAMSDYVKPEKMKFNLSGLDYGQHETLNLAVQNVYTDPATNIKIMAHIPPVNTYYGTGAPTSDASLLSRKVGIISTIQSGNAGDPYDNQRYYYNLKEGRYQLAQCRAGGGPPPMLQPHVRHQARRPITASLPLIVRDCAVPAPIDNQMNLEWVAFMGGGNFEARAGYVRVDTGKRLLANTTTLKAVVHQLHAYNPALITPVAGAAPAQLVDFVALMIGRNNPGADDQILHFEAISAVAAAFYSDNIHTEHRQLAREFSMRASFAARQVRLGNGGLAVAAAINAAHVQKIDGVRERALFMLHEIIGRMLFKACSSGTTAGFEQFDLPNTADFADPGELTFEGPYNLPAGNALTADDVASLMYPYNPADTYIAPPAPDTAKFRLTVLRMGAGILACDSPAENGKLMMAFPFSDVYSSQEDWELRTRVYMGGCVEIPENILIMHDIAFEGVEHDEIFDSVDAAQAKGDELGVEHYAGSPDDHCTAFAGGPDYGIEKYGTSPLGWLDTEEGFPIVTGMQVYTDSDEVPKRSNTGAVFVRNV